MSQKLALMSLLACKQEATGAPSSALAPCQVAISELDPVEIQANCVPLFEQADCRAAWLQPATSEPPDVAIVRACALAYCAVLVDPICEPGAARGASAEEQQRFFAAALRRDLGATASEAEVDAVAAGLAGILETSRVETDELTLP